jgi:hypothetical protein
MPAHGKERHPEVSVVSMFAKHVLRFLLKTYRTI